MSRGMSSNNSNFTRQMKVCLQRPDRHLDKNLKRNFCAKFRISTRGRKFLHHLQNLKTFREVLVVLDQGFSTFLTPWPNKLETHLLRPNVSGLQQGPEKPFYQGAKLRLQSRKRFYRSCFNIVFISYRDGFSAKI